MTDTSGVLQPADTGDELHKATQAADENIYLSAIAVNGTVEDPEEARFEDPDASAIRERLAEVVASETSRVT